MTRTVPTASFRDGTIVERRCLHCGRFVHSDMISRENYGHPVVFCLYSKKFYGAKVLVEGDPSLRPHL